MRRLPPGSSLQLAWLGCVLGVVLALLPAAAAVRTAARPDRSARRPCAPPGFGTRPRFATANVDDSHHGAFSREGLGVMETDASCTTRDDRRLAVKLAHCDFSQAIQAAPRRDSNFASMLTPVGKNHIRGWSVRC